MTENQPQGQHSVRVGGQPQDTEQATRQAGQPVSSSRRSTGEQQQPDVFADGSTREQQEQRIREAEEANRQTKEYADADRDARNVDQSG